MLLQSSGKTQFVIIIESPLGVLKNVSCLQTNTGWEEMQVIEPTKPPANWKIQK